MRARIVNLRFPSVEAARLTVLAALSSCRVTDRGVLVAIDVPRVRGGRWPEGPLPIRGLGDQAGTASEYRLDRAARRIDRTYRVAPRRGLVRVLDLRYPDQASVHLALQLALDSMTRTPDGGAVVAIDVPMMTAEERPHPWLNRPPEIRYYRRDLQPAMAIEVIP